MKPATNVSIFFDGTNVTANVYQSNNKENEQPDYEECLSCQ